MRSPPHATFLLLLAPLAPCMVGCVTTDAAGPPAQRQLVSRIAFSSDQRVTIDGDSGDIHVRRAEGAEAVVRADVRARNAQRMEDVRVVMQTGEAGDLSIRVAWPIGWRDAGESAALQVELPGCAGLTVHTGNGHISVEDLGGTAALNSGNGEISVRRQDGDAEISTRNGAVTAIDIRGACRVRTSNGPVQLQAIRGRVQVVTANGPIEAALSEDNPGPVDIRTANGSVELGIGAAFTGELRMETFNGRVHIRDVRGEIEADEHREWAVIIRGGPEPRSRVRTTNGRIELREQREQREPAPPMPPATRPSTDAPGQLSPDRPGRNAAAG